MKVIFLDIDGVLNSDEFFKSPRMTREPNEDFRGSEHKGIDPVAMARLNRIVKETDAECMMVSSWTFYMPLSRMREVLQLAGFSGTVRGYVPSLDQGDRGLAVDSWLKDVGALVESYVILDDMVYRHHVARHVRTTWGQGLQDCHVPLAIEILRKRLKR